MALCECGCGGETPLAKYTHGPRGWKNGEPIRFIYGHFAKTAKRSYTVNEAGCWIYDGFINKHGYPAIICNDDGSKDHAHVVFYKRAKGPIPEGYQLDHKCRVRACVNPNHLEPVTCAVNVRRGDRTKLTASDVTLIRYAGGATTVELALAFGVSASHIRGLRNSHRRTTWKEVDHAA